MKNAIKNAEVTATTNTFNKNNGNGHNSSPLYIIQMDENTKVHITKGNMKIGKTVYSFSTLPGDKDHLLVLNKSGILLTNIPGTCSKHCEGCFGHGCYAVNSAKLHHNAVIRAWGENTLILRSPNGFEQINDEINRYQKKYLKTGKIEDARIRIFRINVSGEVQSVEEFEGWNEIAKKHPEITFGLYTKNFEDLDKFMQKHGDVEPNFVINISQWHGVADKFLAKYPGKFNVFEYDDHNRKNCTLSEEDIERLEKTTHCPAVNKQGRHIKIPGTDQNITCDRCRRCYRKTGKTTAVWDH